jgi:hypothetical protein
LDLAALSEYQVTACLSSQNHCVAIADARGLVSNLLRIWGAATIQAARARPYITYQADYFWFDQWHQQRVQFGTLLLQAAIPQ